ncbi:protocadherin gamma-B1-like isoform X14 [Apus apus]|uniref:protocadherin gamma-B1-like isoform X14 n=1 Tax=Apus apus TaxID=8895 RepID=UPI0021F866CE|nr:protocadherin gamma-B1-like isoform X14 [Apus apus]
MAGRQRPRRRRAGGRVLLAALLLLGLCCRAAPERIRYAIPEELGRGSLVGPLARDLGLSPAELPARKLRLSAEKQYFGVSGESGQLYVSERLDREEMCGEAASCSVSFEALLHNPLNVFHVQVDIHDVNDNDPAFSKAALGLEIPELTLPGARFPLETARDPDVGSNALLTYQLTSSPSFSLALKESSGGKKQPELVLERALDREEQSSFQLVLTAVDGGDPARSGTVQILVNVTDANDNAPMFSKSIYEERVRENVPVGSVVLQVRATDADAGSNARVSYGFGNVPEGVRALFSVDSESGEVRTAGALDFEEKSKYSFGLEARDGGGLVAHCEVEIEITDENDNAPEITVLSVSSPVPEDAAVGTVVALVKVTDPDSGENGAVWLELSGEAPLSLVASSGGSYKQAQPNTDWRFSQTQRPGTSGSQNGEEGGAWPNNQFDTEMLQAMILASANEAADANSTLGGGTGTMGLSARYGPQFTLQHVPDYRQNVYIPGSTATLTNAAGKRDAKATNPSGGNKKKSGKKEKK